MYRRRLRRLSESAGIVVQENFGAIESFEKTPTGVRMIFSRDGDRDSAEATLAVVAVGWVADTAGLSLAAAGVETDHRGFVKVDEYLRTSTPHIFAAGDITGRLMLVPQAIQDGFVAATNAVQRPDDDDWEAGEPDRQLHGPGICPGGPHRSKGPSKHTMS